MKRVFIAAAVSFMLASCGAGTSSQVTAPDPAAYKAAEVTAKSNSDRIIRLETELDKAKSDIESLRVQNRQLADSYDSMVELFKEHKTLTMSLIQKMNSMFAAPEPEKAK